MRRSVKQGAGFLSLWVLMLSNQAFAALPANFTPSSGGSATEPVANTWAWIQEIGTYAGIGICGVIFLGCVVHLVTAFGEGRHTKKWGDFIITLIVAIIVIVFGLWCISEATSAFSSAAG